MGSDEGTFKIDDGYPLHVAAKDGHSRCLRLMLEDGMNVGEMDAHGKQAIEYAIEAADVECIAVLIECGADLLHLHQGAGDVDEEQASEADGEVFDVSRWWQHKRIKKALTLRETQSNIKDSLLHDSARKDCLAVERPTSGLSPRKIMRSPSTKSLGDESEITPFQLPSKIDLPHARDSIVSLDVPQLEGEEPEEAENEESEQAIIELISEAGTIQKSGYLHKSSGSKTKKAKGWQKRYFVLHSPWLSYSKKLRDGEENDKPTLGAIPLSTVSAVASSAVHKHALEVVTPSRTYWLYAKSAQLQQEWIDALNSAVAHLKEETKARPIDTEDCFSMTRVDSQNTITSFPLNEFVSGWVFKSGGKKLGTWQKRWLELDNTGLSYYRIQHDEKPAGMIALSDVRAVENADQLTGKACSFSVVTDHRSFYFYANDDQEREDWMRMIRNRFAKISRRSFSLSSLPEDFDLGDDGPPPETVEGGACIKQGYMWKTPGDKKKPGSWQRRWFVLSSSTLAYYKQQKAAKASGIVDVASMAYICNTPKVRYGFEISTSMRTYYLYASSEVEKNEWITCICSVSGLTMSEAD